MENFIYNYLENLYKLKMLLLSQFSNSEGNMVCKVYKSEEVKIEEYYNEDSFKCMILTNDKGIFYYEPKRTTYKKTNIEEIN